MADTGYYTNGPFGFKFPVISAKNLADAQLLESNRLAKNTQENLDQSRNLATAYYNYYATHPEAPRQTAIPEPKAPPAAKDSGKPVDNGGMWLVIGGAALLFALLSRRRR